MFQNYAPYRVISPLASLCLSLSNTRGMAPNRTIVTWDRHSPSHVLPCKAVVVHFLFRPSFVFCQCILPLEPILTAVTKFAFAATDDTISIPHEINFPFCVHCGGFRCCLCFVPMMRSTTRTFPTFSATAMSSTTASFTSIGGVKMLVGHHSH
jgi:hypothetical protein